MSKKLFHSPGTKEKVLNKCPICGAELEYVSLYQYSKVYRILKNGRVSKTMKYKRDEGPMEVGFISCSNCDFHTDCDLDCEDYKEIYIYETDNRTFVYEE